MQNLQGCWEERYDWLKRELLIGEMKISIACVLAFCLFSSHFSVLTHFTIAEVAFQAYLRMYDVIAESEPLSQSRGTAL